MQAAVDHRWVAAVAVGVQLRVHCQASSLESKLRWLRCAHEEACQLRRRSGLGTSRHRISDRSAAGGLPALACAASQVGGPGLHATHCKAPFLEPHLQLQPHGRWRGTKRHGRRDAAA